MPSKRKAESKTAAPSKKGKIETPAPEPVVEERVTRRSAAEVPAAAPEKKKNNNKDSETKKVVQSKAKKAPEPSPVEAAPAPSPSPAIERPASKSKKAAAPAPAPISVVAVPTPIIPKPVVSDSKKKASSSKKGGAAAAAAPSLESSGDRSSSIVATSPTSDITTIWKQIWIPLNFALNTLFPMYIAVLFFCYSFPQYSPLPAITKDDAFNLFGLALSYTGLILMASFVLILVPFVLLSGGSFAVRFILAAAFAFIAAKRYIKA